MIGIPAAGIHMTHTGDDTHPGTAATCEAVSDLQADHLETLGWTRTPEPAPELVPDGIADTAAGLEHALADPTASDSTPDGHAPSRRRTTSQED